MTTSIKVTLYTVSYVACVVIGMVANGFYNDSTQRSISLVLGDVEVNLEATQDGMSFDSMYSIISRERAFRSALIDRLAEENIYHIEDLRFPDALTDSLCARILEDPAEERREALRECAEMPVAKLLRRSAESHEIPFHYVVEPIRIGTPSQADQPKPGYAHACQASEFMGRSVELTNAVSNRSIRVKVTGWYRCTGAIRHPDIQLSSVDAGKLFSRPTDKYENALAVVVD